MVKNILFSGLSYSEANFKLMKKVLENSGVSNLVDFGSYIVFDKMSDQELIDDLCYKTDQIGDKVNIICHSMGCNMGLILASERSEKINKAIFLSPELHSLTRGEKRIYKSPIYDDIVPADDFSKEKKVNSSIFSKLRLYQIFKQTRKLALERLEDMPEIDSMVMYGAADKYVSSNGAAELAGKLNTYSVAVLTRHHNLLLSSKGYKCAEEISDFIKEDTPKKKVKKIL